ncbi:MAG TPA: alpha/beta hydrolase [Ktedonobacterales bacterium]
MKTTPTKLIELEEYVPINGIRQYLFHSGTSYENPVMLFLHGGPGSPASLFAHVFQDRWEDLFTVVHWDQRGAGKTLTKNPHSYPTVDLLIEDLLEIIQYLKQRYQREKIVILGHSWGSVLGSVFIKHHPDAVEYYIGVGQVISKRESERLNYARVREAILQANDTNALKKLDALGEYPGQELDDEWLKKSLRLRTLQGKFHLTVKSKVSPFKIIRTSPLFKFSDLTALVKGSKANRTLVDFLGKFDLNAEPADYEVPIYYIIGEDDWQTPAALAQDYFTRIHAPFKKFFLMPHAGHMAMVDQPAQFFDILSEMRTR